MKRRKLDDTSYWPGYVDALVNVVLNILFLVGLMAVGLVTLNSEALSNFKSSIQAKQLQKINEENMLLAALGTLLTVLPQPPKPQPPVVAQKPPPTPSSPTLEPAPRPSEPMQPIQPALPPLVPQPSPPVLLRVGANFSLVSAGQEQNFAQTKAGVSPVAGVQPAMLYFEALQFQTSATHATTLRQLYSAAPSASRWVLLVTVPDGQERASREAFWRLSSVRQQLIELGASSDAVTLRTVVQTQTNFSNGRRIFVYPVAN